MSQEIRAEQREHAGKRNKSGLREVIQATWRLDTLKEHCTSARRLLFAKDMLDKAGTDTIQQQLHKTASAVYTVPATPHLFIEDPKHFVPEFAAKLKRV
jgi:hypothetical protein